MCALESSDARLVPLLTCEEAERQVSSVIPAATWDALMQHQQAGVLAGLRRRGRLLLADEMGLGKTAQFSASKGGVRQQGLGIDSLGLFRQLSSLLWITSLSKGGALYKAGYLQQANVSPWAMHICHWHVDSANTELAKKHSCW